VYRRAWAFGNGPFAERSIGVAGWWLTQGMVDMTPLDADQLGDMIGSPAKAWPGLGLVVTGDPQERAMVRRADDLIGWIEPSAEFPGQLVFQAAIAIKGDGEPLRVPVPAGFIPPDPERARDLERRRWLPAAYPDRA